MNDPTLTELTPARMINEWIYCPRLAYLEWVDGEWADNEFTLDGTRIHGRVDRDDDVLLSPEKIPTDAQTIARGITLSCPSEQIIARLDLVEYGDGHARPVDYKRGKAPDHPDGAWPPERVQICAQALVLRANGYQCHEGVLYFAASKTRVTVPITTELETLTRRAIQDLRAAAATKRRPAPLTQSRKCLGCSLAPICLPDEIGCLTQADHQHFDPETPPRPLFAARDDALPLHVGLQGAVIGLSGEELQVRYAKKVQATVRLPETSSVSLYGNIMVSTQALRQCLKRSIPIAFHTQSGWLDGLAQAFPKHGVALRQAQYTIDAPKQLSGAQRLVSTKIRNQRTLFMRNHRDSPRATTDRLKHLAHKALTAADRAQLLGIEGEAAALYFGGFNNMLRPPPGQEVRFHWTKRTRRPPTDPINALLGFTYAILLREVTSALLKVGLDPMKGIFHQTRANKPALALDLMEAFRPVLADSVTLTLVNNGALKGTHFVQRASACALTAKGRNTVLRAWENRMDTVIMHPTFRYQLSYRRTLEVQACLFGRWLTGEIPQYPDFRVR
jgi:CRISPR-associated exonuclease Cas4/CRISPR-associated protein Cas1